MLLKEFLFKKLYSVSDYLSDKLSQEDRVELIGSFIDIVFSVFRIKPVNNQVSKKDFQLEIPY